MITACAWCEAAKLPADRAGADGSLVSHGICDPHAEGVRAELRARAQAAAILQGLT